MYACSSLESVLVLRRHPGASQLFKSITILISILNVQRFVLCRNSQTPTSLQNPTYVEHAFDCATQTTPDRYRVQDTDDYRINATDMAVKWV